MANNKQVYKEKILPLVQAIYQISQDEKIPFSFSCTADVVDGGTVVAKWTAGNLNPNHVDPYTRINILLQKIEPDGAEAIYFQLLTMLAEHQLDMDNSQEPIVDEDPTKYVDIPINDDSQNWLDDELKSLGL